MTIGWLRFAHFLTAVAAAVLLVVSVAMSMAGRWLWLAASALGALASAWLGLGVLTGKIVEHDSTETRR